MATKTFSIFCIGTDHKHDETYLIMMVMYGLLAAQVQGVDNAGGTGKTAVEKAQSDHHKVVYDGANLLPNSLGGDADDHLRKVAENAVKLVKSVERNGEKITVNLLGHSRGAANCLLIANLLHKELAARECTCNLFLIDTVKFAPSIPEKLTRTIDDNVNELVHLVMEDNTFPLFDLYEIKAAPGTSDERITNIRLPGTHGTATQCNLRPEKGVSELPDRPDNYLAVEDHRRSLWPIGGVALSSALIKFKEWETPLSAPAEQLATPAWQLYYYHRIQEANPIISRVRRLRQFNDSGKSSPGNKQGFVKAPGLLVKRTDLLKLKKFGSNPFRFGRVFVNEDHFKLARAEHGSHFVDAVRGSLTHPDSKFDLSMQGSLNRPLAISTIQRIFYRDYPFLQLLNDAGIHWNGESLFDLLGEA